MGFRGISESLILSRQDRGLRGVRRDMILQPLIPLGLLAVAESVGYSETFFS